MYLLIYSRYNIFLGEILLHTKEFNSLKDMNYWIDLMSFKFQNNFEVIKKYKIEKEI